MARRNRRGHSPESERSASLHFDSLVEEYSERIYNHAFRMLGNREDAEEAASDVFLRIHLGLGEFRGDAHVSTWIWRITTNVCLSRRAKKRVLAVSLHTGEPQDDLAIPQDDSNPEELFIQQEVREHLAHLIQELPDHEAAAISLFYVDGMKYEEIAAILDVPAGTVATALHRGRERLKRRILKERARV
jgi:RNA polymerase sigma-70 factor (ECF subfamily)